MWEKKILTYLCYALYVKVLNELYFHTHIYICLCVEENHNGSIFGRENPFRYGLSEQEKDANIITMPEGNSLISTSRCFRHFHSPPEM